MPFPVVARYKA